MSKTKGYCQICSTEIEVQMCCSGHECVCMGQPIDPPVCSDDCYEKFMSNTQSTRNTQENLFTTTTLLKKEHESSGQNFYDYIKGNIRTDSLVPVRRGCENRECFCTGKCQEIIAWRQKLPNEF
jgi:predicted nucleic acid-binding Zn ribbon protein